MENYWKIELPSGIIFYFPKTIPFNEEIAECLLDFERKADILEH